MLDRSRRVPEQVYDIIRDRILVGQYAPGEPINERGLTETLQVSRTPIREALRRLADDGLIEVIPSVGSRVSTLNPDRICDLAEARTELECLIIRRAAPRMTKESCNQLAALIEAQSKTAESGDFVSNISIDSQFHRVIWEMSDMAAVVEILDRALSAVLRARHLSIRLPGRLDAPIREHRAILDALESGSVEKSEAAMRHHLQESYKSVVAALHTT
jgi:DNA-binding GntR family transcriptional regulator